MIIACATDDLEHFIGRHFGDAAHYSIYEVDRTGHRLVETIDNSSPEEEVHADPKKARGITRILTAKGTQAVMNRAFGPNLLKIGKSLLPMITDCDRIEDGLKQAVRIVDQAEKLAAGPQRSYLKLTGETNVSVHDIGS